MISKERETFKDIYNKDLDKLNQLTEKVNYDDLKFVVDRTGIETNFSKKKIDLVKFLDDIRTKRITLEEVKNSQKVFSVYLKSIRKGNKSLEPKKTLPHINRFFNGRNDAIKFTESYGEKILESKRLAKQGARLKILTPKQMLQRLPIALAQVKAGKKTGNF